MVDAHLGVDVLALPEALLRIGEWGGESGRTWLAGLPGMVEALQSKWGLRLGPPYGGGVGSYVVPATREDGSAVVLKVPFVDQENYAEARALATYRGEGAVRLLDYDPAGAAMLLERADPGASLKDHPDRAEAVAIAGGLLTRLRRPLAPAGGGAGGGDGEGVGRALSGIADPPEGTVMASYVAAKLRRSAPGALPAGLLARAIDWADRLSERPVGPRLLVNRDGHLGNIRSAGREPWLLIDPKPLLGEAALDGGWLLVDVLTDLDPGGPTRALADVWAPRVAAACGLDEEYVRGWALVRAMENAASAAAHHNDPAEDLAYADAVAPR